MGFEPTISAGERPQTYALDRAATGTGSDLYCSPNIVGMIKSRIVRLAGHVARMGRDVHTGFWWGNLRERDHLEDPGIDRRIILGWMFMKWDVGGVMDWIDLARDRDRWRALVNVVKNLRVT